MISCVRSSDGPGEQKTPRMQTHGGATLADEAALREQPPYWRLLARCPGVKNFPGSPTQRHRARAGFEDVDLNIMFNDDSARVTCTSECPHLIGVPDPVPSVPLLT